MRSLHRSSALPSALLALLGLGCGDDGTGPTPPSPQALQIVSGDGQKVPSGSLVSSPLRVRVLGSDQGPLSGATVEWSVTQGQATLEPSQSTTDAAGEAETRVTTGTMVGSIVVQAAVENLPPVTFSITALDPLAFAMVSAGAGFTCALTITGAAYCWGFNAYGQFGDGTTNSGLTATPVGGGLSFTTLSAGAFHVCGVTAAGAGYCWGDNRFAQLGDGTTVSRLGPVPIAGGLSFAGVSASTQFTCGATISRAGYCWGENGTGALGDGSTTRRRSPVPVTGGLSFAAMSAGGLFSCGITTSHEAYCWGSNASGQLGDGGSDDRLAPGPVAGGLSFVALSSGWGGLNHSCGLTTEGGIFCWGPNLFGALGDGTTTDRLIPGPVSGGLSFATVEAGAGHTCGLTSSGDAYCWGGNRNGELGDGTTTDRTTPMAVTGGLRFVALSAGLAHTCGITAEGDGYCWGEDIVGDKLTPTRVER